MLIRHSLYYVVAKLLPGAVGMITTALLTRLLNPTSYGLYGLALVVMTFGSTMVFDWLGVSFLRFYERRRGDPIVFSTVIQIFLALVLLSGVATAIAWACGLFYGNDATIVAAGILMMWAFSWFELAGRFEIANFRPARYVRMNLGRALFIVAGAGSAAWMTHSPVWTAVGTALGTAAGALIGGFKRWSIGPSHFDRELARSLLWFGLPMAASMALGSLVSSGTRTLLEVMDSAEALGLYTACFMLVQNTLTVTSGGIASAAYQLAVRAVESGDPQAAHRQLTENGTLLFAVLAPAALGMALTAHGIASAMVGAKFVAGVTAITPWMAAAALLTNLRAHHLDHAFQLGRRPSLQIAVTGVAAVVAIVLSLVLIPRYGPVGAAMASTAAMAIACVHAVIAGRAAFPLPIPVSGCVRVSLACAVMAVVVLCIPDRGLGYFVARVVAGGAAYTVAAVALDVLGSRRVVWQRMRRGLPGLRAGFSRQGG